MTSKELFQTFPHEIQMQIVKTLAAYERVHVDRDNDQLKVGVSHALTAYPRNEIRIANFESKEFYPNGSRYHLDWYLFCEAKRRAGEKNECYKVDGTWHGKWQDEFEETQKPVYEQAYNYFLKA